ncbi:sulfite exporter TauE/SafE family protein [bacterium CPR1]|nr:sulfite exporter TauE/SafE family protein [bacterium CPR1]
MTLAHWAALVAVGFMAGFVNTLAGSGSLLTLPLLLWLGMPVHLANGTNRISVLLQNVVAVYSFRRQGNLELGRALWPTVWAILGSIGGAELAARMDARHLTWSLAVLMLLLVPFMLVSPRSWTTHAPRPWRWYHAPLFLAVGVYGGFIQGGVGIFLLAGLVLGLGTDLVQANGIKNWIVLWFTALSMWVFVAYGQVDWLVGVVLGLGSMPGAWVAARVAQKHGARLVHQVVVGVVILSALDMLGLFRWLASQLL